MVTGIRNQRSSALGLILLSLAILILPHAIQDGYELHLLTMAAIFAIVVLGATVQLGYTGMLVLVQGAFFGVGAYGSALISMNFGFPVFISGVWVLLIGIGMATLLGIPALRLRGHYFALVTLGYNVILYQLMLNWVELTRGPLGLTGIPAPDLSWIPGIDYATGFLYVTGIVLVGAMALVLWLRHSRYGSAWVAIREDELGARSIGVPVNLYRLISFVVGASLATLGGVLYAHYTQLITPDEFGFDASVQVIVMCMVGGRRSVWGALIGALLVIWLPEYLRVLNDYRMLLYGVSLTLIVLLAKDGIVGLVQSLLRFRRSVAVSGGARAGK